MGLLKDFASKQNDKSTPDSCNTVVNSQNMTRPHNIQNYGSLAPNEHNSNSNNNNSNNDDNDNDYNTNGSNHNDNDHNARSSYNENAPTTSEDEFTRLLNGYHRMERELGNALTDDSGATLAGAVLKRPATVTITILILVLLYLVTSFFSSLSSSSLSSEIMCGTKVSHTNTEIRSLYDDAVDFRSSFNFTLSYSKVEGIYQRGMLEYFAPKLRTLKTTYGPLDVQVCINKKLYHLCTIHVDSSQPLVIGIIPNISQEIVVDSTLTTLGHPKVVKYVANRILKDDTIEFLVNGTTSISKFGINLSVPFNIKERIGAKGIASLLDSIQILSLTVSANAHPLQLPSASTGLSMKNSIDVGSEIQLSNELQFSGVFPSLNWSVLVPDCYNKYAVLCNGTNEQLRLGETVKATVNSSLTYLPPSLVQSCLLQQEIKSPLDKLISEYLAGSEVQLMIRAHNEHEHHDNIDTELLLNEGRFDVDKEYYEDEEEDILYRLLAGIDIPITIAGKPDTEKLIQSVIVEDVMFDKTMDAEYPVAFSGKSMVNARVPQIIDIRSDAIVYITGVQGVIQLFDRYNRHFAQILAEKWMDAITLPEVGNDYQVLLYFNRLPVDITNTRVFADVSRDLVVSGSSPILYDSVVNLQMRTPIGDLEVKQVHIRGRTRLQS